MDRTVPRTGSEEIELYLRTFYSLLRSTAEVKIQTLEEVHANISSSLHPLARSERIDTSALIYSSLRLPECIARTERVVLGQSTRIFREAGFPDVESWEPAIARARRRRSYFDGAGTLALYIASRSDIDDILPLLTAFQIEWNKLHQLLKGEQVRAFLESPTEDEEGLAVLARGIGMDPEDLDRLQRVWGKGFWPLLRAASYERKQLRVRLLAGSLNEYRRAVQDWWGQAEARVPSLVESPVYFVSSNPHSLVNLLSGFALRHEAELTSFLDQPEHRDLLAEWHEIEARRVPSSRENFLYYALKKYCDSPEGEGLRLQRDSAERSIGIQRIPAQDGLDIEIQAIQLRSLRPEWMDPRLRRPGMEALELSEAHIVNLDYPLGMAAYLLLSHIASRVGGIRGVYLVGKCATLNGVIGDIAIASVVHDEHSQNTYLFHNSLGAASVGDDLVYGTVLDNQKAVSVRGTFLQNPRYMEVFYREGYTVIEMETGPYLSAVYEMVRPQRHPINELVDLHSLPFDLGMLHYASDTPLSKGKNLGAGSLSYFGMDPSYGSSLAVLRRIFDLEIERVGRGVPHQVAA
jgi:hypothetical protein